MKLKSLIFSSFAAVIFILASSNSRAELAPSTVYSNQQGVQEMKKSNPSAAQEQFLSALIKNPFEAKLHLNLGLSFEVLGQLEKAQASYEVAAKLAQDDLTRFAANYNLGEISQKAKKVDEALKYYQEALKYNPKSQETKVNIELLTQNQQGQGEGENQDQKDQNKDGQGKGDKQEPKEDEKDGEKGQEKENQKDKPKEYSKNKPQPQKFKSEELTQGDVNKILGEIKQQEQKIRAEFNKKETKEQPRDKDW